MAHDITFPYDYIGLDHTPDGNGRPWWVIQAKMKNGDKVAIVYKSPSFGVLEEVKRYPEIWGPPSFYVEAGGTVVVIGQRHLDTKKAFVSDPVPGFAPVPTLAAVLAKLALLEAKVK